MPDFSHLKQLPLSSLVRALEDQHQPSPEFFDHLLERVDPPLLPEPRMQALRAELCWFHRRPYVTRPPKGLGRAELAAAIRSLCRDDVPPPLLTCIADALDARAPTDRLAEPRRILEGRRRSNRILTMKAVYSFFAEYIDHGRPPDIPLLAERARSLDGATKPRSAALQLTQDVVRADFGMCPPSLGRLRNIVRNYPNKRAPAA